MPFLVVIVGMIVAFVAIVVAQEQRSQREKVFRDAAGRLRGNFSLGGLFEAPELSFALKGQYATMTFYHGRPPCTRLQVLLPPPSMGTLKISPYSMSRTLLRMLGVRDIAIGDGLFDSQYVIEAEPESLAHTVFAPERRAESIRAVRRLNHCFGFSLQIDGRMLRIEVRELMDSVDLILAMTRTAEEFMGFVCPVVSSEGIQMGECADGCCPICSAPLAAAPLQRCDRCLAPHHRECWEYLGRCATYGCEPRPRRRAA